MHEQYSLQTYLKFLIPSILGIFLFMVPLTINGGITIPVAYLADLVIAAIGEWIPAIMTIMMALTALITIFATVTKPKFIVNQPFLNNLFLVTPFWTVIRILAAIFAFITVTKWGPEAIYSGGTGGLLLSSTGLITTLFAVFLFAGLFLPLLLDFGLLDLFSGLLTPIMRPLFKLPGRSSIDSLASWLGDGTIGVLLTNSQYDGGYYTKREAAVIATTFSAVSISFTIVVFKKLQLMDMFLTGYIVIGLAGFVAAIIMPRIPPLSRKADSYEENVGNQNDDDIPDGVSMLRWGWHQAANKASRTKFSQIFVNGTQNVIDMWIAVIPVVMAFGTVMLVIAEYTPVFNWIGTPFVPILTWLQIPEAAAAANTILVGFADMFLPTLLALEAGIESEMTLFIIGCLSITQLIYMSEIGGLILGSKLPVTFWDLVVIFLERTFITLPIIIVCAHLLF